MYLLETTSVIPTTNSKLYGILVNYIKCPVSPLNASPCKPLPVNIRFELFKAASEGNFSTHI